MTKSGDLDPPRAGCFASPDALLTPFYMAATVVDLDIRVEPAWKVSIVIWHALRHLSLIACRLLPCGSFSQRL